MQIHNKEDLLALAAVVNSSDGKYDFDGRFVKMMTKINLGGDKLSYIKEESDDGYTLYFTLSIKKTAPCVFQKEKLFPYSL